LLSFVPKLILKHWMPLMRNDLTQNHPAISPPLPTRMFHICRVCQAQRFSGIQRTTKAS